MKAISILTVAALVATGSAQAVVLSKNTLIPCSTSICGGFTQNNATLSLDAASNVAVGPTGRVTITVVNLRDKDTGAVMAYKSLDLGFGTLQDQVARTRYLGSFMTDGMGNYKGAATGSNGLPYSFDHGQAYTGSFLINDRAIPNTQFSTGFYVP